MTMTKLALVALLGALAVFVGTLVLTLHVLILQRKQHLNLLDKRGSNKPKQATRVPAGETQSSTVTPSEPTEHIHLWKHVTPQETSKRYAGIAYWNQVKQHLAEMGDVTANDAFDGDRLPPPSHIHTSLLQAANHGHPDAQHYLASSLASGVWLTGHEQESIPEDFVHVSPKAMLLWHMAAMEGNVDASVALGHRLAMMEPQDCQASLPYFENAAHNIMDQLEAEPHSRAKVNPSIDKHSLPEIHLHGGTSSQLSWENKPDESLEAIQYYHLLSTKQPNPDVHASYTLGHLYHFGMRGVTQNLTLARQYYEISASGNHWEAAGQAGKFHFWSFGMTGDERNLLEAHRLFHKGAPLGLEGCRERHRKALKVKTKSQTVEETDVSVCDHPSVNGLGLLYLYGVPMLLAVNIEKARNYFQLARDMGNMDASYNLAMLRLGFRAGWKEIPASTGTSPAETVPAFMEKPQNFPSREDWSFAIQELTSAANKGHLQARHRLAMIYQEGVKVGSTTYIHKDCKKATSMYKWVIHNGSPQLGERSRGAYKQYTTGDYEGALVNYMMAAETGHAQSQVNAAFLLERGVCLHLSEQQCRAASLRLWKAAAQAGDVEAALRVGDFYYYGNKRKATWVDAVLFPEVHLWPTAVTYVNTAKEYIMEQLGISTATTKETSTTTTAPEQECKESDEEEVCQNPDQPEEDYSDADIGKAAHYYRLAAQQHKSARANYNLGYMHEWGLGLTQDFPLAKRHYDLAKSNSKQAALAVQIALMSMNMHEQWILLKSTLQKWNEPITVKEGEDANESRSMDESKTKLDVILKHVVSWESLLIIILTWILSKVLQQTRR